ncbi:SHOCT domain-containing protein [Bacillus sp. V3B]|uniref:SHOCT domain-containing protein n=1 Tax=Bacillus sp. V3B TaxID=2804915 RepID=UPI00210B24FC|nr:SHOCT domain-containing protein [Bacillus sp. V3B]MCQ6274550.1 SHOCT domain-containing protein [Bacillus sp. V3B]
MMGPGYGHYGGFGMGGGSFMMIVVILIIGIFVYMVLNKQNTGNGNNKISQPTPNSEAIEIVKSRFARGEITVEEFEQIKKKLL